MDTDNSRFDTVTDVCPHQHLSTRIPYAYQIALGNTSGFRIIRVNRYRLTIGNRVLFAQRSVVQLTMQTMCRVRRQ